MPYLKDRYRGVIKFTLNKLEENMYTKVSELKTEVYKSKEPLSFADRTKGEYALLRKNESWGQLFDCGWFHFTGKIPAECKGKRVDLLIDVNGEGCIFSDDGVPMRGITCVSSGHNPQRGRNTKRLWHIANPSEGNEIVDVWMDAGCNDLFGTYREDGKLYDADIAICNVNVRDAFYDLHVLDDLLDAVDEKSAQYNRVLFECYYACLELKDLSDGEILKFREKLKPMFKETEDSYLKFTAIGHAHIDLGWLWPIRETKRKGARTFSTVIALMDEYPEYKFGASQPQLYQWIKEEHPKLYEKIKEKVKEGRWELQGCMWVEADANLAGGESLVRQILYGKRFFMDEFGVEVKNLWLPDVFGYSASLPQLLKKSGCDYFMTQKLSWSQQNKFPHHTFIWQGIDGTEIFTHMLPEGTYNGPLKPTFIKHHAEENYSDSGVCDESLMLFGIGDGGGGPGPEFLERYRRVRRLQGLSHVDIDFAEPLFERLEKKTEGRLQKWAGELYLERHQGTYTSQAKGKYYNRKIEFALRELEFALILSGEEYPQQRLEEIWKEILLYQFHDIIPGSSIKRVYDEAWQRYEILWQEIKELTKKCYGRIAKGRAYAFNSLNFERTELVEVNGKEYFAKVPALGYANEFTLPEGKNLKAYENVIENEKLIAKFGEDGALISLYDKLNCREALSAPSNIYSIYKEEDPTQADCWDINLIYVDQKPECFKLTESKTFLEGAKAICRQVYEYNNSKLYADLILEENSNILKVKLHASWYENLKMLRTAVNTDILTDHASFEIQYGKINRANNDNTLIERAKFELCGHKWVDLSQSDYGVSLLNDSKYGFRTIGKSIDINLLRSQNNPGIDADKGEHHIIYAIYPHTGDESVGQVSKEAYALNNPLYITEGVLDVECDKGELFKAEGEIVIEAIKKAEDSGKTVIRAYEPYGNSVKAVFRFKDEVLLTETDLMERNIGETKKLMEYQRSFKPFEIVTFTVE
ncbi:MAG: alpha-mannosidase [Ruminococcaceae bacterium]|nr:alpha-mannosidase [Oscillospiraceae bacterium]